MKLVIQFDNVPVPSFLCGYSKDYLGKSNLKITFF